MSHPAPVYQPPTTASMIAGQNELRALRLSLAQRKLYSRAKRWSFLRSIGFSVIGVAAPIVTVILPEAAVGVGALAGIWIFVSRTWFSSVEQELAAKAADIQEQFDQLVFSMPEQVTRVPSASMEEIATLVGDDQAVRARAGLMLGAASEGDLRVGREQKRIRAAVESALHRDLIQLDVRPAATTSDLLDGITKFRPHVVHFSGHSNDDLIVFEDEVDEHHRGVIVAARAFANAVAATDDPPLLVLLNSCNSASQIDALVERVVPIAIGMTDEIAHGDAINYTAQFYAAVANGQSIRSAHLSGQAALELAGLSDADLPRLAHADDVDPSTTVLVKASE